MTKLATAEVDLVANTAKFRADMAQATRKFEDAAAGMQRAGSRLSTRLTLPLVAVGAVATKLAIDAEEVANKFAVVMGDSADRVRARFAELADVIPLTGDELEKLAAGTQDLLVPLGIARNEAADMSLAMVELAGDLASFNNVRADVPLEALKSALAGQSRPLRQFGIDVSETRLKALAFREGIISTGEELTASARAQAILRAAMLDSTDSIGDAARTADSAANTLRFLRRDSKELAQQFGDILKPAVVEVAQALRSLVGAAGSLSTETQTTIVVVGALTTALGPVLLSMGSLAKLLPLAARGLALLTTPIGATIATLTVLAGTAAVLVRNFDLVKIRMTLIWAAIRTAVIEAIDGVLAGIQRLVSIIPGMSRRIQGLRNVLDDTLTKSLARTGERLVVLERELVATGGAIEDTGERARSASRDLSDLGGRPAAAAARMERFLATVPERADRARDALGSLAPALGELPDQITAIEGAAGDSMDAMMTLRDGMRTVARDGIRVMSDFGRLSARSVGDFVVQALGNLAQLATQILIIRGLLAAFPGLGSPGGLFADFAGGFAAGGRIPPGSLGVVGERGPELALAGTDGALITPSARSVSSSSGRDRVVVQQTVQFAVSAIDARDTERFLRENGGVIADVVADAASSSRAVARRLRGGR